jgi:hypothetical protein
MLIVKGSIASLNVTVSTLLRSTPVALVSGLVEFIIGNKMSTADFVVKLNMLLAVIALPAMSFAPVVTVAVYVAVGSRLAEGMKVALFAVYDTTPATNDVPFFKVKVEELIVV